MIGVADTSPISALLRIGRLALLTEFFESVLIPAEVAAELDEGKHMLGEGAPARARRNCRCARRATARSSCN